jgi:hypothetical protein
MIGNSYMVSGKKSPEVFQILSQVEQFWNKTVKKRRQMIGRKTINHECKFIVGSLLDECFIRHQSGTL